MIPNSNLFPIPCTIQKTSLLQLGNIIWVRLVTLGILTLTDLGLLRSNLFNNSTSSSTSNLFNNSLQRLPQIYLTTHFIVYLSIPSWSEVLKAEEFLETVIKGYPTIKTIPVKLFHLIEVNSYSYEAGLSEEFIKVAAPLETLGRAAAELQIKKPTYIGMDLQFEWDEVEAFVRQPDGSLLSWCERFCCFTHLLYGIINKTESVITLMYNNKVINWKPGESLVKKLEFEGIVKKVFPLHDETKRKQLMRTWALNWLDLTHQPIDEIYTYFGTKIATYFAFLGMYTRWMLFPAALALTLQLIDFGIMGCNIFPILEAQECCSFSQMADKLYGWSGHRI